MPIGETKHCRTFAQARDEVWLIKFTSINLALGHDARQVIEEVAEAISQFTYLAKQQGVSKTTVSAIAKTLELRKQENAALFQ